MCSKTAPKRQDDRLTQKVSNHGWLNVWFLVENIERKEKLISNTYIQTSKFEKDNGVDVKKNIEISILN